MQCESAGYEDDKGKSMLDVCKKQDEKIQYVHFVRVINTETSFMKPHLMWG